MTSKRSCNQYKRYCCVYGCLNKRKKESELTFFKVPGDIERRQEWLKAIDREDLLDEKNKAKYNYVCSAHFDNSAVITSISKRLESNAVPTKFLPHKSHKNIQSDVPDLITTTNDTSTHAPTQTSKNRSSHLSKKDNIILVSTYSHTQSQTDTQSQKHTLPHEKEIEREIAKVNIDNKSLNELKHKSTVPSEPTTSTSQSLSIKKPKVTSTSTQTDLNETSNKMTQTTSVLSDKSPKRKLKTDIEIVKSKRLKQEIIKIEKE